MLGGEAISFGTERGGKMLLQPHKLNSTGEVLTRNSGPFGAEAEGGLVTDVALVCCGNYCSLEAWVSLELL